MDAALTSTAEVRPGTRITLSSPWTPVVKWVFPAGALAFVVLPGVRAATAPERIGWSGHPPPSARAALCIVAIAVLFAIRAWSVPLKRVALDGMGLWASNYLAESGVPWKEIRRITVRRRFGPLRVHTVTVELRGYSPYGGRFAFVAAAPSAVDLLRRSLPAHLPIEWVDP